MINTEIIVTYLSYRSETDVREWKEFSGKIKDLIKILEKEPLSDFHIHFYQGNSPKEFSQLGITLEKCWKKAIPYENNMY